MADRIYRLKRIHNIMDIMWRCQLRHVASLDARLSDTSQAELKTIVQMGCNIPVELAMSRLRLLHPQRLHLEDEIINEKTRAKATGLKLKLLDKFIANLDAES